MNDNETLIPNDIVSTFQIHAGQEQTYIYKGESPPSYWDSPISASQLIVTIILLLILCVVYRYSNLEDDDEKSSLTCTCPKNVHTDNNKALEQLNSPPPDEDHVNVISELDSRLRQLEAKNLSHNFNVNDELIAMRGRLERVSQWLQSCRPPEEYPGKVTEV